MNFEEHNRDGNSETIRFEGQNSSQSSMENGTDSKEAESEERFHEQLENIEVPNNVQIKKA
jgi:hypothetical protein